MDREQSTSRRSGGCDAKTAGSLGKVGANQAETATDGFSAGEPVASVAAHSSSWKTSRTLSLTTMSTTISCAKSLTEYSRVLFGVRITWSIWPN
jgi:hypothetical protein